jgi:hypothetical protein
MHDAKPYMCLAWGLDQISVESRRRRSRLRGSCRGRRPIAWSSDPAAGSADEVRQHGEAPLGGEEKTAGQSTTAVAPLLPLQPLLLHASVASIAGCSQPHHELPDQRGKQEHQPQQAQAGSDRPRGTYEVNVDSLI